MSDFREFLQSLPDQLTLLIASILGDIKIIVPLYAAAKDLSWWNVMIMGIIGNSISAIFLLSVLVLLSDYLRRKFKFWDKFFGNLFAKTKLKYKKTFERWGELAVILAAAIPLPGFGGWTASLVAFVFGIRFRRSVIFIILGITLEAFIVTLLSFGIKNIV